MTYANYGKYSDKWKLDISSLKKLPTRYHSKTVVLETHTEQSFDHSFMLMGTRLANSKQTKYTQESEFGH